MKAALAAIALGAIAIAPAAAQVATGTMGPLRPDQQRFRDLYEELVETNTTLSAGSCTQAAEQLAARLRAAGLAEQNVTVFSVPEHPKEGGLVAIYAGTNGFFDSVAVPDVRRAEVELLQFMASRFGTLLTTIREKKTIDDTLKGQLNAALKEFNDQFAAAGARA
jgi:F0F1-type ATP synthase alpha subunit